MDPSTLTGLDPKSMLTLLVVAQFITFLGTMAVLFVNYLRDGRTRRWLVEDRFYQANAAKAETTVITDHATVSTNGIHQSLAIIKNDIAETRKAAADAYSEANHVNLKLEKIGMDKIKIDEAKVAEAIQKGVREQLLRLRDELKSIDK